MGSKTTVTRELALQLINESKGRIVAVEFRKRSDGSIRRMAFRIGVKKYLTGRGATYDPKLYGLLTVFDMSPNVRNYRSIPVDGLIRIKVKGQWRNVK